MAGTIRTRNSLKVTNGNSNWDIGSEYTSVVQTAMGGPTPGAVATSTTAAAVDLTELTTEGWCRLKNLDTTISIHWGPDKGASVIQKIGTLEAGEVAQFRLFAGAVLMLEAASGTPVCEVLVFED